ncbi:MAG: hypothetical protein RSE00_01785 [Clostridia bacterium]
MKIRYLLDLHVMDSSRKSDICIGTGLGKNIYKRKDILEKIIEIFEDNNFKNISVDDVFASTYKHTVSSTIARRCSIPCFQIEINFKYVNIKHQEYSLDRLVKTMSEIVDMLEQDVNNFEPG